MTTRMKHWIVISPEYGTMIPIMDDGTGPMEYGCDVVCVDAETARQAKVAGVRKMRETYPDGWLSRVEGNPYNGIYAKTALCPHLHRMCDCASPEEYDCEQCADELRAEAEAPT